VRVRALMTRKNDFTFTFGPANTAGEVSFDLDTIRTLSDRVRATFLMDYLNFPEDWSGRFDIRAMSLEDMDKNLQGIAMWGADLHIPNLREALSVGRRRMESLAGADASIVILRAPEDIGFDMQTVLL
jgi:hypothetical protein